MSIKQSQTYFKSSLFGIKEVQWLLDACFITVKKNWNFYSKVIFLFTKILPPFSKNSKFFNEAFLSFLKKNKVKKGKYF